MVFALLSGGHRHLLVLPRNHLEWGPPVNPNDMVPNRADLQVIYSSCCSSKKN